LARKDWVVYAKPPFGGPATVLDYLARYTHRVAISNHRLTRVADGHVSFTYGDRQHGKIIRELTLPADHFIDRSLQHVLPPHFLRIRHVGFLANRTKKARLAQCRRLLHATASPAPSRPAPDRIHALTGIDPSTCPQCHTGTMVTTDHWAAGRLLAGSRAAYEQFLRYWKDVDGDLPVLAQARRNWQAQRPGPPVP